MLGKTILKILTLLLLSSVFLAVCPSITVAQNTKLYVDPPSPAGLEVGSIFQINITVSNVLDLYAWQFTLFYRGDILNATNIEEGPFLKTHPDTDQTYFLTPVFTDSYNNTDQGKIISSSTLVAVKGGVNGTGTLATITFKVKAEGSSPLVLAGTILADSFAPFGNKIPHTTTDGIVRIGQHDVAVVDIKRSKTVTGSAIVYLNVTVENHGNVPETFNVTAYYNSSSIETKTVTNLEAGSGTVVPFSWDPGSVPKGKYTMSAVASTIPGETNTTDNTYVDSTITKTIVGDVDGNFGVDIVDISQIAIAWQSTPGDPAWNPNCDLDNNNVIDIVDIGKAAINFGMSI